MGLTSILFAVFTFLGSASAERSFDPFRNCAQSYSPAGGSVNGGAYIYANELSPSTDSYGRTVSCHEYNVMSMGGKPVYQLAIEHGERCIPQRSSDDFTTNPWDIFIVLGERGLIPARHGSVYEKGYVVNRDGTRGDVKLFSSMSSGDHLVFDMCVAGSHIISRETSLYVKNVDDDCVIRPIAGPDCSPPKLNDPKGQ